MPASWSFRPASTRPPKSTAPTRSQQFRYITLPQLRPILLINTILISIFTLNTFDLILPLTGGGPGRATEVLALYAYNTVFRNFDLSNGAVLAVMLLADQHRFTLFYVRLLPKESDRVHFPPRAAGRYRHLRRLRVIFLFFAGPLLWLVSLSIRTRAEVYVSDIRAGRMPRPSRTTWRRSPTPLFADLPLERPEARRRRRRSAPCCSPRRPPTRCRASASATATWR